MSITTAIGVAGAMITVAIGWSIPHVYDYHTDLKNISYQLSRIADVLNKIVYESEKGGKNERTD